VDSLVDSAIRCVGPTETNCNGARAAGDGKGRVSETGIGDLADLWSRALDDLHAKLTGAASRAWLNETTPVGYSEDTVVLAAPHSFAREQLDTRFGPELRAARSTSS
jgi:hypothetical protein